MHSEVPPLYFPIDEAFVSKAQDKGRPSLKEAFPHSSLNDFVPKDTSASTFERPLTVITARDQQQQILKKRCLSEQDSDRNSIVSSETLMSPLHSRQQNLTMPLTPPDTPTKQSKSAGADALEMSTSEPRRRNDSVMSGPRFGKQIPSMPAKKRPRIVYRKEKTGNGKFADRRTSTESFEKQRPESRSFPARTASLQPEYTNPHFGDPCTHESLDHLLGCGHRITTMDPEPCSSNCHVRDPPDNAQLRDLDSPFTCHACIVNHLQASHEVRLSNFTAEIQAEAARMGKSREWVDWKISLMATGWADENLREMKQKSEKGKFCHSLWIDPDWRHLVDMVMYERQQKENSLRRPSLASLSSAAPTARPSVASSRPSVDNGSPPSPSPSTTSTSTVTSFRPKHLPALHSSVRKLFAGRENKDTLASQPAASFATEEHTTTGAAEPISPSSTTSQSTIKTAKSRDSQ